MICENFVMISSLIKITSAPLTYSTVRSVYTHEERFAQTLKTIDSVKEKIPNCVVCLVECSLFDTEEETILKNKCDIFINLYQNEEIRNILLYSPSKSLCEALQTLNVILYIRQNNIKFNNFFKITGRYVLNENFKYELYDCDKNVSRLHPEFPTYCFTSFYKLTPDSVDNMFGAYFRHNYQSAFNIGIAYEECFKHFLSTQENTLYLHEPIGIDEYISVNGNFFKQ